MVLGGGQDVLGDCVGGDWYGVGFEEGGLVGCYDGYDCENDRDKEQGCGEQLEKDLCGAELVLYERQGNEEREERK